MTITPESVRAACLRTSELALPCDDLCAELAEYPYHIGSCAAFFRSHVADQFSKPIAPLIEALQVAQAHIRELREAWHLGCISEHDGQGGTRSNRNRDVEVQIDTALAEFERPAVAGRKDEE